MPQAVECTAVHALVYTRVQSRLAVHRWFEYGASYVINTKMVLPATSSLWSGIPILSYSRIILFLLSVGPYRYTTAGGRGLRDSPMKTVRIQQWCTTVRTKYVLQSVLKYIRYNYIIDDTTPMNVRTTCGHRHHQNAPHCGAF